jgi:hypothetical protein
MRRWIRGFKAHIAKDLDKSDIKIRALRILESRITLCGLHGKKVI